MEITSSLKYLRIAPRKVRLVTRLIKGLSIEQAEQQLKYSPKRSGVDVLKLLKSAKANAIHNHHIDPKDLYISKINVTDGPTLKRTRPRARGSAYLIRHRSCHIVLTLKPIDEKKLKKIDVKDIESKNKTKKRTINKDKNQIQRKEKTHVKAQKGQNKNIIQRKVIN
ncbi:MAG: 50S ribosomal protein L22 [Candidatus Pacebacteria bacterium]|nr:50S ribosomal protein L22 [Candidatus Paceibacterota bacterium]